MKDKPKNEPKNKPKPKRDLRPKRTLSKVRSNSKYGADLKTNHGPKKLKENTVIGDWKTVRQRDISSCIREIDAPPIPTCDRWGNRLDGQPKKFAGDIEPDNGLPKFRRR